MKTFSVSLVKVVFYAIISILLAWTICIHSVSALPQQQTGVKITNPANGQQMAIGKNLTLSGTSSYSPTSNCGVLVIVDGVKPYQKTIPIGQGVGNNYSKWKYTLTSTYAGTIKQGTNRITAKLLCNTDPVNLTKFYSINVTGTTEKVPQQHQMMIQNTNSTAVQTTPLINHLSFSATSSASTDSSNRHHHHSTSPYTSSYASSSGSHHHGGHAARGGYVNCRVFIQSHGPCL